MAYSENVKNEALIKLAINKYNYELTASDTGVPSRTLRRWDKNIQNVTKNIPELLERVIQRLLMVIPPDMTAHDWMIALGILIDKWQLIRGEPTSRTESRSESRIEAVFTLLQSMTDDELNTLQAEFQAVAGRQLVNGISQDTT